MFFTYNKHTHNTFKDILNYAVAVNYVSHPLQVRELEEKAYALLDNGATGLQKLWRGMKGRALVTKMKKSKKKGSKKKKKK